MISTQDVSYFNQTFIQYFIKFYLSKDSKGCSVFHDILCELTDGNEIHISLFTGAQSQFYDNHGVTRPGFRQYRLNLTPWRILFLLLVRDVNGKRTRTCISLDCLLFPLTFPTLLLQLLSK